MISQPPAPADKATNIVDKLQALVKEGRHAEARALLEEEKIRTKYEPNSIESVTGKPTIFRKGRQRVEQGPDGNWRPIKKV